ncbi:hypothetical protein LXA43DRAFT_1098619 [Ganoderma leucocontextum]|nr:hypothetical protein LXA43DRAFT_1098619 [Ganoderma leucocontextum]
MAEGSRPIQRPIESCKSCPNIPGAPRRAALAHFPRPSTILFVVAACLTRVKSQASKIQIIVSDELTECVPSNITWIGGSPPYTLGIGVGNFNHGPDQEFSNLSTMFFVWSTDVPAENSVQFAVGDTLTIAYSGYVDINAGLAQSCLPAPLDPFTSSSGGSNPTKTQGAPPSASSTAQPPPTSIPSTTVTVSVTDSAGGTNTASPGATTSSSTSGSSHSSLSPDVIGIIVAVAVALLIVVIWILYKRSTRPKPDRISNSSASTSPSAGTTPPFPIAPTSPTLRPTSVLPASPNYSPVASPPGSALQLAPYGHPPPPVPHPAWQGAAAIHTTQTYFVGGSPGTPGASRAPSVLSYEPSGWNSQAPYMTQWRPEAPMEQAGRLATIHDDDAPGEAVTSEGGSVDWRPLLSPPQVRRP